MATQKTQAVSRTTEWSAKKRYKVNDSENYNGNVYQNVTGFNSEPGVGNDWILLSQVGIKDVIAGTNITIDKTDPKNPIFNASVGGSTAWGAITGTLADQTDLQGVLNNKLDKNISTLTAVTLPIQDTDVLLVNRGGVEYKVNKSDIITGGASKKTQIIEFAWSGGNYSTNSNWWRLQGFVSKYATTFQNNATITPTNNFADDTSFCFHETLMFNGKIKAITIEGDNNGASWNCDFALVNFELASIYNAGTAGSGVTNRQIVGRKQFVVGAGGFQTRTFWTAITDFGDILLYKNSIIKPYFKSEGVANSNWQNVIMKILIEEI